MNNEIVIFNQLKSVSKQSDKIEILTSQDNNEKFKEMLKFLLSKDITTGLNLKKLKKELNLVDEDIDVSQYNIFQIMNYLKNNNTGKDVNIKSIQDWIEFHSNEDEQDFYYEFFTKSFKSGVGIKLANKIYGSNFIQDFSVQLANSFNKLQANNKIDDSLDYVVTQKLDGIRCLTTLSSDIVLHTRQGKSIYGLIELEKELNKLKSLYKNDFVLDGELLAINENNSNSDDLFRITQGLISNKEVKNNIEYYVFDILTLDDFKNDSSKDIYLERRKELNRIDEILTSNDFKFIKVVKELDIIKSNEVQKWLDWAIKNNYEGIMLNEVNSMYQRKRSNGLLKVKQFQTADLQIVDLEIATIGQFKGLVKSVIVRIDDDNFVNVGSGLSEEDRSYILNHKDDFIGKMTEVKYFEISKDKNGKESLRFPIWTGIIRDDKSVKDTNLY